MRCVTSLTAILALLPTGCASASGVAGQSTRSAIAWAYSVAPQPPAGSCHARGSGAFALPDVRCTPGAVDHRVTQENIGGTICRRGYTRRVRPAEIVTRIEKRRSMAAYGDQGPARRYEYDHLIPLELGGAPNDPRNLWPQPGPAPNPKDELEYRLHREVCAGGVKLITAQHELAKDWVATYRRMIASVDGYSVVLNSQIATASITSPISSTIPASNSAGT